MEKDMLTVQEAIKQRRSIRGFSSKEVPDEFVAQMLEAARLAPSGSNRQPWNFIVVRDPSTKKELRRICLGQHFIEQAPVLIVCFANLERYSLEEKRKRRVEFQEAGVNETLSGRFADPAYREQLDTMPVPAETARVGAIANTYIAIEHMVLTATALGLGTCWVGGFDDASEINRLFGLKPSLLPIIVLPVGYPEAKTPAPRPRLKKEEIVIQPERK
ncbi:MAG: nitroreductase family protein [Dehalococcoidales bacterium]|nr:nitroreductase family protein [Dehalococcoidales bacterium]